MVPNEEKAGSSARLKFYLEAEGKTRQLVFRETAKERKRAEIPAYTSPNSVGPDRTMEFNHGVDDRLFIFH